MPRDTIEMQKAADMAVQKVYPDIPDKDRQSLIDSLMVVYEKEAAEKHYEFMKKHTKNKLSQFLPMPR